MNIQEDVQKLLENGYSKDEFIIYLLKKAYNKEEILAAVQNVEWPTTSTSSIRDTIPRLRIISGILFAIFALDKIVLGGNHGRDFHNLNVLGLYWFGLVFLISLLIKTQKRQNK
ncbi:MAG: hypothetical protein RL660_1867 [Bacteroidota bacterium]|jgi:hypothetical protein